MKNKLTILISLLVILASCTWLGLYSYKKINTKIIEEISVVSHLSIYEENGYPVYTEELVQNKEAFFVTDISLDGINNKKNNYDALVSQDKAKTIKVGNKVYIPKTEETLRNGFTWEDTSKYTTGEVVYVSKEADWKTGFYKIGIKLEEELPKQPFYSAKVVNAIKKNIVLVPIVTLDSKNGSYYAWIDENSKAVQKAITTGICDGYNCEIISGLVAGDRIITSDRKLLTEGMLLNNRGTN